MNLIEFLFIVTFIFGVVELVTKTKLFNNAFDGVFDFIYWKDLPFIFRWLDKMIFLFSLGYQCYFWFNYLNVI